jgi:small subunit ribosomal protein S9
MEETAVKSPIIMATGRRKTAVARVNMRPGSGIMKINGRDFKEYFPCESQRCEAMRPLLRADAQKKFDVQVRAEGGGLQGQAGAASLAIARALVKSSADLKSIMREHGLLTRDSRAKERKKSGQPGARKRFQFSKR